MFNFKKINITDHFKEVFDLLSVTATMKGINFKHTFINLPKYFTTDPNRL